MSTHCVTPCGTRSCNIQLSILRAADRILRDRDYRGLHKVCRFVGAFFPRENSAVIEQEGRRLKIYLDDPYWLRYLFLGFTYEEEVASFLEATLDERSVFIDCGANTGYWSVYAARKIGSNGRVVAVEPARATFARLCENMDLNDRCFKPVQMAAYSRSGASVQFLTDSRRHEGNRCLLPESEGPWGSQVERVETVALDDLFEKLGVPESDVSTVVVKLDVEGAEREAFQGARRLMDRGALFVYEDHGRDSTCRNTDFVLNHCGLDAFLLQCPTKWVQIQDVGHLAELKTCPWKGYNLLAARRGSLRFLDVISARPGSPLGSVATGEVQTRPRAVAGSL